MSVLNKRKKNFLNILHALYFPHAYASGLWLNVGTLSPFSKLLSKPPRQHIRVSPLTICPEKKGT